MKKIITIAAAIAMATNIACAQDTFLEQEKIGRASCRERV